MRRSRVIPGRFTAVLVAILMISMLIFSKNADSLERTRDNLIQYAVDGFISEIRASSELTGDIYLRLLSGLNKADIPYSVSLTVCTDAIMSMDGDGNRDSRDIGIYSEIIYDDELVRRLYDEEIITLRTGDRLSVTVLEKGRNHIFGSSEKMFTAGLVI